MNENTPKGDTTPGGAPGSAAGDAAPTQQIPRVSTQTADKPATDTDASGGPVTDKGRARDAAAKPQGNAATTAPEVAPKGEPAKPVQKAEPKPVPKSEAKPRTEPNARETTAPPVDRRPLTAADYVRTTTPSAATTSVMPVVKDDRPRQTAEEPAARAQGRRANLRMTRVDPWSVTRLAFAISVALMIVSVVAMSIFWLVLESTGVWGQVNEGVNSVLSEDSSTFDITDYLGFGRLIGLTLVLSAINVILMTALATIGAHLYNLSAQLLGGVEMTFAEDQ